MPYICHMKDNWIMCPWCFFIVICWVIANNKQERHFASLQFLNQWSADIFLESVKKIVEIIEETLSESNFATSEATNPARN